MGVLHFIADPTNDYLGHTRSYLVLCGVAILIATFIGIVVGVAVSRSALLGFLAVNVSGLLRAIPVIAFLIAAFPFAERLFAL